MKSIEIANSIRKLENQFRYPITCVFVQYSDDILHYMRWHIQREYDINTDEDLEDGTEFKCKVMFRNKIGKAFVMCEFNMKINSGTFEEDLRKSVTNNIEERFRNI